MRVLFVSSGKNKQPGVIVFSQGESLKREGIALDYLLAGPGPAGYLSSAVRIRRAWKRGDYDLVHAHYSLSAFAASMAGRFPLVVSLMGSDLHMSGVMRMIIRTLYRHRWATTIVKSLQMQELMKLSEAELVPNGVDAELFRPLSKAEAREFLGYAAAGKIVLFGSSPLRPEKNAALAREAVALLHDNDVELKYLSGVPHVHVPYWLNAADVLLLTSGREGSPNVVKEAMACNCPVVATDVGDVRWLFKETAGCYIALPDAEDVAAKLRAALDPGVRSGGRERIMKLGLDSGSVAVRIKSIYERVIS